MSGSSKLRVIQLQRRTFAGHYSMERVFEQVRSALPEDIDAELYVASHFSKGLLPRLRTVFETRRLAGDVLHVTGDITYAGILSRVPTVITVHDTEFLDRSSVAKRHLYRWLWLRLPARRSRILTVPSDATRADLLEEVRLPPDKVRVIANPVGEEFSFWPPAGNGLPVVLIIGTRPNKNLDRCAEALAGLECRTVVVGELDDRQRSLLESAGLDFESRVNLGRYAVRDLYRECDLLLFPSTKEGFGLPILEAQATGRPVVTSSVPPMSTVSGGAAQLVDPHDAGSIREGVEAVLGSDRLRRELVEAGLENVARYRAGPIAEQYAAVYREAARSR
ncbi:MAG TPA: glycosyltransferase family 1 protein [Acidimicrobiales bacterium]|nr:glycosyltransferase family 1 protein [Acidimicrobiales bacterium]